MVGKTTFAVFLFAIINQSLLASLVEKNGNQTVLHQEPIKAIATKTGRSNVNEEICAVIAGTIFYCPGDTICCTPGDPGSRCCPKDHPLCIGLFCCPEGYPQICGPYCCTLTSFCCNGLYCCQNTQACCGVGTCCTDQSPCCKEAGKDSCCDKDTQACCDEYGCVEPCQSQFDAIGCTTPTTSYFAVPVGSKLDILYRILRPDEDPQTGLVAKNPSAAKTVLSHVNCGSRPNYKSQYISTSTSLFVTRYYKEEGEKKGLKGLRIAEINLDQLPSECKAGIVDLTIEANRDKYLGNAVCKYFAKASQEVLLVCDKPIPCKVIEESHRKDPTVKFSELYSL